MRIDDVNPSFDVFPLGKVLWCMASGEKQLPYWWHRRPRYDIEILFPDQPHMALINETLDRCLVDSEEKCLLSAKELLEVIDERLDIMRSGADRLSVDTLRACRVCGKGQYWPADGERSIDRALVAVPWALIEPSVQSEVDQPYHRKGTMSFTVRLFACNACGHIQMFSFPDGRSPKAWKSNVAG